MYQRYLLVEE